MCWVKIAPRWGCAGFIPGFTTAAIFSLALPTAVLFLRRALW
ncbi:hypothetical protein Y695_03411 [Hydrogenophaga sp. T4]|nr:hypothetical protein Y695_03411 [Hydrogenophaga sp. T4]